MQEIPLTGGNINQVARVGDTVRRRISRASPTIHQLLQHLEARGFAGSPRFLGMDSQGREKLSFFEGETGTPGSIWQAERPLIAAAELLRGYHDATLGFAAHSPVWGYSYPDPQQHEVICHNDFAPYNWVYRNGIPYAVIDFDLAGPGPRLRDVAYAVYWLTPLSFSGELRGISEGDLVNNCARLRLFCQGYGIPMDGLLDMVAEVLGHMGDREHYCQILGEESTANLEREGHLAHWQREAAAFLTYRNRLEFILSQ